MKVSSTITSKSSPGFTLTELIISILLFGIIGILLVRVFLTGAKFYEDVVNGQEVSDNMFIAQQLFSVDIASLRDSQHILYADSTRLRFVDSSLDTIQYRYAGGTLYRSINNTGEHPIAYYLTDSTSFYYFDIHEYVITENPIISTSTIWYIRLKLNGSKGSREMTFQSLDSPHNLKYGIVK